MVTKSQQLQAELEQLLGESTDAARERERSTFERLIAPFGHQLVLSGAGNLGRKVLKALRAEGIEPLAFVDGNPSLWGREVEGLTVLSHAEGARRFGQSATFCVTIWRGEGTDTMAERLQPLVDLGCANVIDFGPLVWRFSDALLPHYSLDLPHKVLNAAERVRAAFDLWCDDASRAEYVAQVRWRLRLDFDNLPLPVKERIYFPPDLYSLKENEVFVDCGAYDGDTIRDFLKYSGGRFARLYAFEADPQNFVKLQRFVSELPEHQRKRIEPIGKATGEREGLLRFSATGTAAASVAAQGIDVPSVALDNALSTPPTLMKMDIEGSEVAALRGAQSVIARYAPILCICVYHSQDHLWNIPLQIASSHAGYKMFLRPHLRESWDLVCYAIPEARLQP